MDFIWSFIGFVIVIGILVSIHEWGHFQVARWFDIKVLEFSIGFGKTLWQRQRGETLYKVCAIPLGGFVRFVDEREGNVSAEDLPRAFNRQSVYKRIAVVAAGPLINLIFAWLVFIVIFLLGISSLKPIIQDVPANTPLAQVLSTATLQENAKGETLQWELVSFNNQPIQAWNEVNQRLMRLLVDQQSQVDLELKELTSGTILSVKDLSIRGLDLNKPDENWLTALGFHPAAPKVPAFVGHIAADSPAAHSNLQLGDQITQLNMMPIANWSQFVNAVQQLPGQTVQLGYQRNGAVFSEIITLDSLVQEGQTIGRIGLGLQVNRDTMAPFSNLIQYDFSEAILKGWQRMEDLTYMSLQMLKKMLFGEVSLQHLSGPLTIAQMSGQAVQTGLISFLGLLGLLSLSIGILNLLPIPVLDGGHLLYYLVEIIKGSPVSERIMLYGQSIGLFLIISLTLLAVFNDILRISNG
ncbi:putative zinc metalloprotease [Thiosulfatimonas sediminis]|uniref:Zinc metalloprotease n=1 Tax=Thiosulfatimonas sediminis TaxID=2675054 RepID=A0A6F8PV65_9GAMM|nr:RIP metalloprotease RseP [Thiosulfatimonas sediminis]BBP45898.1 putative zinc metalloprotease [Thiosulfatimonas sediminis]